MKKYVNPIIEIIEFDKNDVITASEPEIDAGFWGQNEE